MERGGAAQTPALNTGAETQCQFSSVQVSSVQVAPQETAVAAAGIAAASVTSDDANADTVRATTGVNGERDGTATHAADVTQQAPPPMEQVYGVRNTRGQPRIRETVAHYARGVKKKKTNSAR